MADIKELQIGNSIYTFKDEAARKKETTLTNQNLNDVKTVGFYNAGGGNSCANKPAGVDNFGMVVVHYASGNYYVQDLYGSNKKTYRRFCQNGTWGAWAEQGGASVSPLLTPQNVCNYTTEGDIMPYTTIFLTGDNIPCSQYRILTMGDLCLYVADAQMDARESEPSWIYEFYDNGSGWEYIKTYDPDAGDGYPQWLKDLFAIK